MTKRTHNQAGKSKPSPRTPRPHVGILFKCCNAYARAYLNATESEFVGYCPKCGVKSALTVGPNGSDSRFWTVG